MTKEVVTCGECLHRGTRYCILYDEDKDRMVFEMEEDDHCSYGKDKTQFMPRLIDKDAVIKMLASWRDEAYMIVRYHKEYDLMNAIIKNISLFPEVKQENEKKV